MLPMNGFSFSMIPIFPSSRSSSFFPLDFPSSDPSLFLLNSPSEPSPALWVYISDESIHTTIPHCSLRSRRLESSNYPPEVPRLGPSPKLPCRKGPRRSNRWDWNRLRWNPQSLLQSIRDLVRNRTKWSKSENPCRCQRESLNLGKIKIGIDKEDGRKEGEREREGEKKDKKR